MKMPLTTLAREFEEKLHYRFVNPIHLLKALTHKSFAFEAKPPQEFNEVFELLGDAVLTLNLTEILVRTFPTDNEGDLSKKRASLVNEETLARVATQIGIQNYILLGRGEVQSGGCYKPRLLASAFEAILGAIFMDGGFEATQKVVGCLFKDLVLSKATEVYEQDYKSRLQEIVQARHKAAPVYLLLNEEGPAHDKKFIAAVSVHGKLRATGMGRTKKMAEQEAAKQLLGTLDSLNDPGKNNEKEVTI